MKRIKLKEGAIPVIFPNCPDYLSAPSTSRESAEERRIRNDNENLQTAIQESLTTKDEYEKNFCFNSLAEFLVCVKNVTFPSEWSVITKEDSVTFVLLEQSTVPSILLSAKLVNSLQLSVYTKKVEIHRVGKEKFPLQINNINKLVDILNAFQRQYLPTIDDKLMPVEEIISVISDLFNKLLQVLGDGKQEKLGFLKEQLQLLSVNKQYNRYSPEFSVFCSILYTISPHAYKFLRSAGYITVPHPQSIHKICVSYNTNPLVEQNDTNFLTHMKQKFNLLKKGDHIVSLMIDEIHVKPYLDYTGGTIIGSASNSDHVATSAHVFMVQSLRSSFKEVVHILPVRTINAESLFSYVKKIIIGLHQIGFTVVCVVSDNNAINRKAMSYFSSPPKVSIVYQHPCNSSSPLFFVLDSVHIIKCIRNNWINQKDQNQSLKYPSFNTNCDQPIHLSTASFSSLKKMYQIENKPNNLVKYSYRLNLKSLAPSNFERQNVKYVLNVFNDHVIQGLLSVGNQHAIDYFQSTAEFIKIILNWWYIVNVKTTLKDERFRNPLQKTLALGQENFAYLEKFLTWLDLWNEIDLDSHKLTKETHLALSHTTYALIELTKYCISELNFSYILPGKIQTDSLEARFGKYRTMAGSQYLVSIRQIFEVESKLRIQNLLPLTLNSDTFGKLQVPLSNDMLSKTIDNIEFENTRSNTRVLTNLDLVYTEEEFADISNCLPVFTYLGGYCARAVIKRNKCEACQKHLVLDKFFDTELNTNSHYSLIKNIDRGGLLYPHPDVVNVVLLNYITVQKLICSEYEKEFLQCTEQRELVIELTEKAVKQHNFFLTDFSCNNHSKKSILYNTAKVSTNIILNNYVKIKNDNFIKYGNKKRKLSTVKH